MSGPPSAGSSIPSSSTAPPAKPPPRPRSQIRIGVVVVAIAVVVVILLSLTLLGGPSGNPSQVQRAVLFSTARSTANATASAHGTWLLADAEGWDSAKAVTSSYYNSSDFPHCNITSFTGPIPTTVDFPAYTGNLSSGAANVWAFEYYQPSRAVQLEVLLIGGVVTDALELSGSTCTGGFPGAVGNAVDSSVAVANALGAGGSAFLKVHPSGVSLRMSIQGPQGWFFSLSTCSLFPDSFGWIGNGSQFSVLENETTGSIIPGQVFNQTCGGPPPIGDALGLGTPSLFEESRSGTLATQGCLGDDYCYTIPITRASLNVTPGNLTLGVFLSGGGVNSVRGYAILDSTGQVVVWSGLADTGGPPLWWNGTGTSSTLITTSMRLSVDIGGFNPAGGGYDLVVNGWGPSFALDPYYEIPLP